MTRASRGFGMVTLEAVQAYSSGAGRDHKGRVFLALLYHGIGSEPVWPSTSRVGEMTGLTRRQVSAALQRLRADGVITQDGCVINGVKRWRLEEPVAGLSRQPVADLSDLGCRVKSAAGCRVKSAQTDHRTDQEQTMAKKYRDWPEIDRAVQDRITRRFIDQIEACGCTTRPSMMAVGVREGLGAQAQVWRESGMLDLLDSDALWAWVDGEVRVDGVYVGKDPSWAWKTILGKLDKGRHLKLKQRSQLESQRDLQSKLDSQSSNIRRRQELESRAADGDLEAMRELYGETVVQAYLKSHHASK